MLRLLVLALVLANAAYAAWSHGFLARYGAEPATQSEPQRVLQQIRPDALRVLAPPEARPPPAPLLAPPANAGSATSGSDSATLGAASPGPALVAVSTLASVAAECLQVGLFNEEQAAVLRARLQSVLPEGSWVLESTAGPARWMIYMGKYGSAEALAKKRGELRQLRVPVEPLNNAALEPGLSLGSFASEPEAQAELGRIAKRGVRSARVIQASAGERGQKLRLPAVNDSLRPQLESLRPQLAGKTLQACT